jgi:hypothetical protein
LPARVEGNPGGITAPPDGEGRRDYQLHMSDHADHEVGDDARQF